MIKNQPKKYPKTNPPQTLQVSVWVNERNHIKIISRGFSDLRKTFVRFVSFHRALQLALEAGGHKFALDPNLGYLATCPSDLGTGVRAVVECSFKANKVNQLANFPDLVARLVLVCGTVFFWFL